MTSKTNRDLTSVMVHLISEELNKHRGNEDAYMVNMTQRIMEDKELLDYLTHPSLRSIIAQWTRDYQASERVASRPENQDALDRIEEGGFSSRIPQAAAIMTRTNGRDVLTKTFLDQYRYGVLLRDWVVCDLRETMSGRLRAMNTERRELKWMGKICDLAESLGGSDKVRIGDHVTDDQAAAILKGEEPPKVKPRRTPRGDRPTA